MAGVFLFAHPEQAVSMGYGPRPLSLKIDFTRFLPLIIYRCSWKMTIHVPDERGDTIGVFIHGILVICIQALRIPELSLIFCVFFLGGHFAAHFVMFFESALHADCY